MIFAGIDLAQRLERAEALSSASFIDSRRNLTPETGAEWIEVAGALALYDGPGSPLNQTFGLGIFEVPSSHDLDRLEAFFRERDAPVCHEVSPLAGVELAATLAGRGYRPIEFTSVMHRDVDADAPVPDGPSTRPIRPGEEELWARLAAEGWEQAPELIDFFRDFGSVAAHANGCTPFFVEIEGRPIATAALVCHNGVAHFAGASTLPAARKRGAQAALLHARMRYAAEAACDLAMMCAAPGSPSQRNAERLGFRIAYTRIKWSLPA